MAGNPPRWLESWRARHRSRLSFWLHMLGIPLSVVAVALLACQLGSDRFGPWWLPPSLFALGYGLQYFGHRHEGNDMGEIILLKRMLGLPYVSVSARYPED